MKLNPKIKFEKKFKPDQYFKHVFGIIRNNLGENKSTKVHKVTVENYNPWIYEYVLKYPIHHTQQILQNDAKKKYVKFTIEIELDRELENYFFKHSSELRVLKPNVLRENIINRLNEALEAY